MKNLLPAFLFVAFVSSTTLSQQTTKTALDIYYDSAGTIFVGRCSSVGPVNILLRARTALEVLYVVKGNKEIEKTTVHLESAVPMSRDGLYLVRTDNPLTLTDSSSPLQKRDSVIPVLDEQEFSKLREPPPKIVILRTINIRVDQLESQQRFIQYELGALLEVKKGN